MDRFLILAIVCTVFSVATSVKEWKNFENGKVYSHKTPVETSLLLPQKGLKEPIPIVKEKILHSHRRDKKLRANPLQTTDVKERHHKKSVEEEMHLMPLNERHHKFPNPALLDKYSDQPSQITRNDYLQQRGKMANRRRQHGRRLKRTTKASFRSPQLKMTTEFSQQPLPTSKTQPIQMTSYW